METCYCLQLLVFIWKCDNVFGLSEECYSKTGIFQFKLQSAEIESDRVWIWRLRLSILKNNLMNMNSNKLMFLTKMFQTLNINGLCYKVVLRIRGKDTATKPILKTTLLSYGNCIKNLNKFWRQYLILKWWTLMQDPVAKLFTLESRRVSFFSQEFNFSVYFSFM